MGRDLFEVALAGKEDPHRIIRHLLDRLLLGLLHLVQHLGLAGRAVLLGNLPQLVHNDGIHLAGIFQRVLHLGYLTGQALYLLGAFQDIFAVEVTQLNLRHILRLLLINAEADH